MDTERLLFESARVLRGAHSRGVGTAISFAALRKSALAQPFLELSDPAKWVASGLCALVLGLLAYPLGWPLDKLYDFAYVKLRRRRGDPLLQNAIRIAEGNLPGISKNGNVYEWAKNYVEAKDSTVRVERGRLQGLSKMFRSFSLMFLVSVVFLWIFPGTLWATLSALAFFFSFLLFCQLRWQATNLVYQRLQELMLESGGGRRIIAP